MLSMTTDYFADTGSAEPYLRRIAEAGFTRVHWCHEWNSDYLYSGDEVRQIGRWLDECGLKMLDLHASASPVFVALPQEQENSTFWSQLPYIDDLFQNHEDATATHEQLILLLSARAITPQQLEKISASETGSTLK